jgi:glycosyltransferase involved in cell wall biosynthesis
MPRVSVIIIFLDAAQFLEEAVASVQAQSVGDWEIIFVDDGSVDGSSQIARGYARRHPQRVRYFEHERHANLGMSASRNVGIRQARGEYVCFLDADDIYLPYRLESHLEILEQLPHVDMVQSDFIWWHSWQDAAKRRDDDYVRTFFCAGDRVLRPPLGLLTILAVPFLGPGVCNVTVRRRVALEVGGFEERFRVLYEDQAFVSKVYLEKTVYALQGFHARYRRHEGSWSSRVLEARSGESPTPREWRLIFETWLRDYVRSRGPHHGLLAELVDGELLTRQRGWRAWLRRSKISAVTTVRRVAAQWLPRSLYRRLRTLERALIEQRARRQYWRLCQRLTLLQARREGVAP